MRRTIPCTSGCSYPTTPVSDIPGTGSWCSTATRTRWHSSNETNCQRPSRCLGSRISTSGTPVWVLARSTAAGSRTWPRTGNSFSIRTPSATGCWSGTSIRIAWRAAWMRCTSSDSRTFSLRSPASVLAGSLGQALSPTIPMSSTCSSWTAATAASWSSTPAPKICAAASRRSRSSARRTSCPACRGRICARSAWDPCRWTTSTTGCSWARPSATAW